MLQSSGGKCPNTSQSLEIKTWLTLCLYIILASSLRPLNNGWHFWGSLFSNLKMAVRVMTSTQKETCGTNIWNNSRKSCGRKWLCNLLVFISSSNWKIARANNMGSKWKMRCRKSGKCHWQRVQIWWLFSPQTITYQSHGLFVNRLQCLQLRLFQLLFNFLALINTFLLT